MKKMIIALLALCTISLCGCSNSSDVSETNIEANTTGILETSLPDETTITTISTMEIIENPDIRNFYWGMSVDEVKAHEDSEFFKEEVEESITGIIQTLITYRNVSFNDYSTKMVLCVEDGKGLTGVNYHITGNYYDELYESIVDDFGEPVSSLDENNKMATWEIPQNGYSIMLIDNDSTTQYSFFYLDANNTSHVTKEEVSINKCPVKVSLENMSISYKDTSNWVFSDYILFTFGIENTSAKDIKGISGIAVFNDMFGSEIMKVKCDLTKGVSANSSAIDDTMSLEINEYKNDDMKLRNTPYEDIQFEYIVYKIVYEDGTVDEY
jgi:hypothetical protein